MMKRASRPGVLFIALSLAVTALEPAAPAIPDWLAQAALAPVGDHPAETEAVFLLDERMVTVRETGTIRVACRVALRILRPGGIDQARQLALASGFDTKILSMNGWGVTEGRKTVKVTVKDILETGLAPDTLYTDICMKVLNVPGVGVGSLVGFEWEEERKPLSLEDLHTFQGPFPSQLSRYSVAMPSGWSVEAFWVNWPAVEPRPHAVAKAPVSFTWEIADIPAIGDEPLRPGLRVVVGRLMVKFKSPVPDARCFSDWGEVGAWYEALSSECRAPTPYVEEKARALVGSAPDPFARLRALAEFVQTDVRYVAIEIGIGGFKPHNAGGTLYNLYGDCKDKATLLAALLQASGVESHYLLVNSARGSVEADSPPSLYSFNHVVLSIRLPDDVPDEGLPAVIRHPRLDRLLVFDPTSPFTPLGRLPHYLQGNFALLVAEGSGELLGLPQPEPEANSIERRGRFALDAAGSLQGEIEETRRGALADAARAVLLRSTDLERRKYFETFLAGFFGGFTIRSEGVEGLHDIAEDLVYRCSFSVPGFAKKAGGMTVVRPRIV
ncbi:MAG TPA: DUF3857 domain-containing protein, partial [Candidatus Aminicenantes bacterium]|nr:DUF3857 domain-containing protein [Candidatus Aminicenantes bacterium]